MRSHKEVAQSHILRKDGPRPPQKEPSGRKETILGCWASKFYSRNNHALSYRGIGSRVLSDASVEDHQLDPQSTHRTHQETIVSPRWRNREQTPASPNNPYHELSQR